MFDYLQRGALAGAVGGGAYGLYVALVGNPLVTHAESLSHHGHEHAAEEASVVSEGVMHVVSIGGSVALGVLFGLVVFGLAGYLFEPALPDRGRSYLLGIAGFLTASGVPWLAVPPAAPGVEQAMTTRTAIFLYAGMMVVGAVACIATGVAYHRLRDSGRPVAALGGLAAFLVLVGPAALLAPTPGFHSDLPAAFETAYLGTVVVGQLGLWGIAAEVHSRLEASTARTAPSVTPTVAD